MTATQFDRGSSSRYFTMIAKYRNRRV